MPRGAKDSGKTAKKAKEAAKVETVKTRKPYPSHEERLAAVDASIERLTKLNAERAALIEKTEALLAERKAALVKSEDALAKQLSKKEKLVVMMNRPAKTAAPKMTDEERTEKRRAALAKAREVKKAEREKYDAFLSALAESGKSMDDLLAELKK